MLQINLRKILADRKAPVPGFVARLLEKIICQDELNATLRATTPSEGSEFARRVYDYFDLTLEIEGLENIPAGERFIFASNHPLGGLDGIGLILALGPRYGDENIRFLVNDMLMHVEPLRPVFLPINKYGAQGRAAAREINAAYASAKQIIIFPAGLVSRMGKGGAIADLQWQKSFVAKALEYGRGIVPVTFVGLNRKRFYRTARWRRRLGLKINIEQALLPSELVASRGKKFHIIFHRPISRAELERMKADGLSLGQIADRVRQFVYSPNSH